MRRRVFFPLCEIRSVSPGELSFHSDSVGGVRFGVGAQTLLRVEDASHLERSGGGIVRTKCLELLSEHRFASVESPDARLAPAQEISRSHRCRIEEIVVFAERERDHLVE